MRRLQIFFNGLTAIVLASFLFSFKTDLVYHDAEFQPPNSHALIYSHEFDPQKVMLEIEDSPRFHIFAPDVFTTDLVNRNRDTAFLYYQRNLNEESAEIWLHRGFQQLSQGFSQDIKKAQAVVISGYLHLNKAYHTIGKRKSTIDHSTMINTYVNGLENLYRQDPEAKEKPHLMLIPTWNPKIGKEIGLKALVNALQRLNITTLWSVGFERNSMWQHLAPERIIPIPYVVQSDDLTFHDFSAEKKRNFVFYAGDGRKNAKGWAGCHRDKLILPLQNVSGTDVRLVTKNSRLKQADYNRLMRTSEYCLILCGDTPSSRSLTSAMVFGCIPIRIGSRLRGLCEPPCHRGYGWKPTGENLPHLPYANAIQWSSFPEIDEQRFIDDGHDELQTLFRLFTHDKKTLLRLQMNRTKKAWLYGWGNPVNSTQFGDAAEYVWKSFWAELILKV